MIYAICVLTGIALGIIFAELFGGKVIAEIGKLFVFLSHNFNALHDKLDAVLVALKK